MNDEVHIDDTVLDDWEVEEKEAILQKGRPAKGSRLLPIDSEGRGIAELRRSGLPHRTQKSYRHSRLS